MAKSWQYPRWRRAALQATLWLVLGSTVGLAAWVSRRQAADLRAELGPPTQIERVRFRPPADWRELNPADPVGTFMAVETGKTHDDERVLKVTEQPQPGPVLEPAAYLQGLLRVPVEGPEPFRFLGHKGVLFTTQARYLNPQSGQIVLEPGLYACTVLPDGWAITIQLVGERALGPSGRRLLRDVARSMTLTDDDGPEQPPVGGPV